MQNGSYGFIVTHDKDGSLTDYNAFDDNTDVAYVAVNLPPGFFMKKGDSMVVTLFLSLGIDKTVILETSLPMKSAVSLD